MLLIPEALGGRVLYAGIFILCIIRPLHQPSEVCRVIPILPLRKLALRKVNFPCHTAGEWPRLGFWTLPVEEMAGGAGGGVPHPGEQEQWEAGLHRVL